MDRLPIGIELGTIGVDLAWWRSSARRLDEAGYAGVWCWDHFVSRGVRSDPVLECWTTLTATAAVTDGIALGTFVANVMNRHPALLARMVATFQEASGGRLVLGMGIGGFPGEMAAYGVPFPPAVERAARLEEAIAVLRALWTGGPVTRESPFYPLRDAVAWPIPDPLPAILVAAASPGGARLAARAADGLIVQNEDAERVIPAYLQGLGSEGRDRASTTVLVGFPGGRARQDALRSSVWTSAPREEWAHWHERGADGVLVTARTTADVDALVAMADRW